MSLEIWSFIVDLLSLFSTIALAIAIYWLESKHTKEREQLEDDAKQRAIVEAAKVFLIDNEDEIDYLPLSSIAQNLKLKRKHVRAITSRFLRCSDELQKEILQQANFTNNNITMDDVSHALNCLEEDMASHNWGRSILYDNAKYLHRALERYSNERIEDYNPYVFENFFTCKWHDKDSDLPWRESENNTSLSSYMYAYLHPDEFNIESNEIEPPINMVYHLMHLGDCNEKNVTFWVMRIIIDSCFNFSSKTISLSFDENLIQTQEDMYYYTLLVLYETYCQKEMEDKNE